MAIYFDVGANDGSSSVDWAKDPTNEIYAFEPNPYFELNHKLMQYPNYYWYSFAVSDYNGKAQFNICEAADRGCSSLKRCKIRRSSV